MTEQDIKLQIQALSSLKQELEAFVKDIENRGNSYYQHVKALEQNGLDINIAKKYEQEYWNTDYGLISQLAQHITTYDIAYIDQCLRGAVQAQTEYGS